MGVSHWDMDTKEQCDREKQNKTKNNNWQRAAQTKGHTCPLRPVSPSLTEGTLVD